jgi:cytochrome c biogenesis protein CcmG, thiol:disulfide interchange protein DsbE
VRRGVAGLVALTAAVLLLVGCGSDTPPPTAMAPDRPSTTTGSLDVDALPACPDLPRAEPRPDGLPDTALDCLGSGPAVRLSDLRGTPMVLNIWAAWCQNCDREMPLLAEAQHKAGTKLRFFGVHYKAPRDYGLRSAADFGVTFPSVHDEDGDLIARELQAFAPPQTFFVTADGRIAGRKIGEIRSAKELAALIKTHLGGTV